MRYKARIKVVVVTADGISEAEIKAPHVTDVMYEAATDLLYAMSTGRRAPRRAAKRKSGITRRGGRRGD